jgi:hypothetical protein
MSKKDFENKVRDKFDDYQEPVSNRVWTGIEQGLTAGLGLAITHGLKSKIWLSTALVATAITSIVVWESLNGPSQSNQINIQTETGSSPNSTVNSQETTDSSLPTNNATENSSLPSGSISSQKNNPNLSTNKNGTPAAASGNSVVNLGTAIETQNQDTSNSTENQSSTQPEKGVISKAASFSFNKGEVCIGEEISFSPINGPTDGSYLWNFGDGKFSVEPSPKHQYLKPGTYDISLSVTDNKNAQITTVTTSNAITILPTPDANFLWDFRTDGGNKPSVQLKNQSLDSDSYIWSFDNGNSSKESNPSMFLGSGKHLISITAINTNGCKDSKSKFIMVNADDMINCPSQLKLGEAMTINGLKGNSSNFKLMIFDHNNAIFETNSTKKPWMGLDKNGQKLQTNQTYQWVLILTNSKNKETKFYSGNISLNP